MTRVLPSEHMKPWLASVRHLRLRGYLEIKVDASHPVSPESRRVHRFIHDFAGHLPNLQSLQLVYLDWHLCPPHPSAYLAISRFTEVRELVLHYCEFPSFTVFRRLLVALPALSELSLKYSSWPAMPKGLFTVVCPQRRPGLSKLRIVSVAGADYTDDLFRWLLQTPSRTSLNSLTIMSISRGRHRLWRNTYTEFVQAIGSRLSILNIPVVSGEQADAWSTAGRRATTHLLYTA
ncbi:hypothetical protein C8Q76DRAFT_343769 [Earliella scabrosa]|nr:hypothetical protein C8Q76DRAFT_343769 [Earliella scabrosa]